MGFNVHYNIYVYLGITDIWALYSYKRGNMSEKQLVDKIRQYLRQVQGCFSWKEHGGQYGTAGIPDIICCYRGKFIAFEVKVGKNQATALQNITIRDIIHAGGYALVVRSVAEVQDVISALS